MAEELWLDQWEAWMMLMMISVVYVTGKWSWHPVACFSHARVYAYAPSFSNPAPRQATVEPLYIFDTRKRILCSIQRISHPDEEHATALL